MKIWASTFIVAACLAPSSLMAQSAQMSRLMQENSGSTSTQVLPPQSQDAPRAAPADLPTTSTVMRTNSMTVLDDKKRLGPNDHVSFRVVEDRDDESQHLRVNDNGELEVPYAGLIPAAGKTCKQLAYAVKAALEKEYYYNATVIIAVERVSERSRGRVYVSGHVRGPGPQDIPADEVYTVSKAIIRAGGFSDFAKKNKVKVTRRNGESMVVDVKRVIEKGKTEEDVVLQPDDQIFVDQNIINVGF